MSDFSGMRRFRAMDYGNGFQLTAVVIVISGVALLAVAAFLVSYAGTRAIAVTAGVSPALAGLYPLIIDAVLVVACVAALALRGAEWWMQTYAWLSVMFMLAVVALVGAVHAAGVSLPHRPMRGESQSIHRILSAVSDSCHSALPCGRGSSTASVAFVWRASRRPTSFSRRF